MTLYPGSDARLAAKFQQPVWPEIHQELKKKGVTKQLLWEEYTRLDRSATAILSQLPTDQWHQSIGDNTLADAILDRLMHNAHRINLKGE